jgi:hypothetical protein
MWACYRERVNALRGRSCPEPASLRLEDEERRVSDAFLDEAAKRGCIVRDVVKLDPLALAVKQLEITTSRSRAAAEDLQTPTDWARECLSPHGSPLRPTIRASPNAMDVDLPHGEFALLFDAQRGFVLGEALRCVTVTTIGARVALWAGYHRAYASAAYRAAGERTVLAALVDDVGVSSLARSCGLRAVQSDHPPLMADFFNPDLALPVHFRVKRFTMEIRARVVAT